MAGSISPLYLLIMTAGATVPAVLARLCVQMLDESGDPAEIVRRFDTLQRPLTWIVPLVFVLLHWVQAGAYLRREVSGWLFVCTWGYFALFTAIDYVWLSDKVFRYAKDTGAGQGGFSVFPLVGAVLIGVAGLASLAIFSRLRARRGPAGAEPAAGIS